MAAADRSTFRVWAVAAPYETRGILKARGYRWSGGDDGRPRAWWIDVAEEAVPHERRFLMDRIHGHDGEPLLQALTAADRFQGR